MKMRNKKTKEAADREKHKIMSKKFNLNDHTTPAKAESSTTVFRLVEEIVKYI